MTSCAIIVRALRWLGAHVTYHIPLREDDGRGLTEAAVRSFAVQGAQLIVTTDCGSANVAEVALAHTLGMDVIVTDHHTLYGELPDCILVNPLLATGESAPLATLAGAGVAFHLADALLSQAQPNSSARHDSEALLDLAATGIIGDVVSLTPHTWALARAGLQRLRTHPQPGLRALLAQADIPPEQLTERDVSFTLVPRLNAAARLDEPLTALELLISDDPATVQRLAAQLENLNQRRQQLTDEVMTQARAQIYAQLTGTNTSQRAAQARLVFVVGDQWPLGIIGLVAGRLAEEFGCAAIVLSRSGDECRGSARGPEGVNLIAALAAHPEFFRRFGGHERAAGFTLATEQIETLRAYLLERLAAEARQSPPLVDAAHASDTARAPDDTPLKGATEPLLVDCRLPLNRLTFDTYQAIRALAPYGAGFAEPHFVCQGARIMRCWRSGIEGRNLRLVLRDQTGERVFLWGRHGAIGDALRLAAPTLPAFDVVYTLDAFRRADGVSELVLRILAMRPARQEDIKTT